MSRGFMSDRSFLPLTSLVLIPCQSDYLLHRSNSDKALDVPFLFFVYITGCNKQKFTGNEKQKKKIRSSETHNSEGYDSILQIYGDPLD